VADDPEQVVLGVEAHRVPTGHVGLPTLWLTHARPAAGQRQDVDQSNIFRWQSWRASQKFHYGTVPFRRAVDLGWAVLRDTVVSKDLTSREDNGLSRRRHHRSRVLG